MTLISEIYQRISSKHTLYVRLFKNRVEIKHLESGKSIERISPESYSNNRLIIADYTIAEEFVKSVIKELLSPSSLPFEKGLRVVLQAVDSEIKEITATEGMIYMDFAQNIGAREVFLCDHQKLLNDEEILNLIT